MLSTPLLSSGFLTRGTGAERAAAPRSQRSREELSAGSGTELKELGSVPSTSAKQVLVVAKGSQEFISARPKTCCFPSVTVGARGPEESGSKKNPKY